GGGNGGGEFVGRPAFVNGGGGEVAEKLGVGGGVGAEAEVAGSVDESRAEVVQPDTVDEHAGGERIVAAGDGLGEFEAAAAFLERLAVGAGEDFGEFAWNFGAAVVGIAANEDLDVVWFVLVNECGCPRWSTSVCRVKF